MNLHFYKYQGTGNDFIILDNRENSIRFLNSEQIQYLCDRRFGIGADGLMLLQLREAYDFEMVYYNADGHESSMCGNGGRCLVKFAQQMGIVKDTYRFIAIDGMHEAMIDQNGIVKLQMQDVSQVKKVDNAFILNTGSPHYVTTTNNIHSINVYEQGRAVRYSDNFKKEGINVNFVERLPDSGIFVRTYERGVEDETLSCGTGVTAAALVSAYNNKGFNNVQIKTKGGDLAVEFEKMGEQHFSNIWLCGPAQFVFEGDITV